ncbi:Lrp/AsnC family transcriptional regulator [Candidatus Woesearchaeota archaeon]|nr:Lrp/AsnC family transcriptional regulator [Candidatus Woesearchaeota archaeon]
MKDLDLLDTKILFALDLNSSISYSKLAKKLKTSKEVINYRINRLNKKKYIAQFYTIINPNKFGFVAFKLYLNFQDMDKKTHDKMIAFLKENKMVFWVASSTGTLEMMIGIWARNHHEFNKNFLVKFMNKFSKYISEKETSITLDNFQRNRSWFLEKKAIEEKITNTGGETEKRSMNKIDYEILRIIANDSRKSYTEIAKEIKSTLQIVRYQIRKMEKEKIILHYKLGIDPKKYGREFVKTFISLKNTNEQREKQLINYCLSLEPTLNVVRCIGPWEIEIEMEIPNLEEYNQVMSRIREEFLDIIKSYKTAVMIQEDKVTFIPQLEPE